MKTFISWLIAAFIALIAIMVGGFGGFLIAAIAMGLGFSAMQKSGTLSKFTV